MDRKRLIQKIEEGIRRTYDEAQSIFPRKVTWDEVNTQEVADLCKSRGFIWTGFYLPKTQFDQIVKDLSKGTRYSWRWPRRSEISKDGKAVPDPEWDEYHAAYEAKTKELEEKKITLKEFNSWQNEMGKKYGMQRRNYDRESIDFNIWNVAPNTNEKEWVEVKTAYDAYISGDSPEDAAKKAVHCVTQEAVDKEYESRKASAEKYDSPEDFRKSFLDKEAIKNDLEGSYERRVNTLVETIQLLKDAWDQIFSKKD